MCVCVSVCVSVCVCLCVCQCICLYVYTIVLAKHAGGFSETWHDDRFLPNLEHGLKVIENGYHGNKERQKKRNVIFPEKPFELYI